MCPELQFFLLNIYPAFCISPRFFIGVLYHICSREMAPFPYLPMVAIMASLVTDWVLHMNVVAYAGFMVVHLGVVDDKDKAGEIPKHDFVGQRSVICRN